MKTFAWLSLVAAAVAAQQNGIPSGVSQSCSTFLNGFNSDSTMTSIIQPLLTATARFLPSANMPYNAADIKWAMDQMTTAKSAMKASDLRTIHTNMWNACQSDLTSGNQPYLETTFELFYMLYPMINAVVSKDTDGSYCLSKAKQNGGHTKRGDNNQASLQIVPDDWKKSHVHYLFANPDESAAQLCTPCVKQVLTAYVTWENQYPFPMGISSSNLLGDQKALWTAINNKCPADFAAGILTTANAAPVDVSGAALEGSTGSRTVISTTGLIGALIALSAALA